MTTPCGEYRKEIQKCNIQAGTQVVNQQPCSIPTIQSQTTSTAPMRPRSVYTAHSYHAQTDDTNFQVVYVMIIMVINHKRYINYHCLKQFIILLAI